MSDERVFQRRLKQLESRKKELEQRYRKQLDSDEVKHDIERVQKIAGDWHFQHRLIQADMDVTITRHLCAVARRLLIATPTNSPNMSDMWGFSQDRQEEILTPLGIQTIRDSIHNEIKKQWERRFIWLQPIAAILSLLVALGGLTVAILSLCLKAK